MNVKIKRLSEDAVIPKYAKQGDSGFDLVAIEDVLVRPSESVKISTGLAFEIPEGYELQIRPRSGITSRTKLRVQFGTVDSGYRGEVKVSIDNINALVNMGGKRAFLVDGSEVETANPEYIGSCLIKKGDRIAQGVITPVIQATFEETDQLSDSERGENGFGSTGVTA